MCGIFALIKNIDSCIDFIRDKPILHNSFIKGQNRGPEHSILTTINEQIIFGFHRLAINGLDSFSNQPIISDGVYLICNGEIYNYKEIYSQLEITPNTNSDCEAILHMYLRYGIEYTLQNLDGVFSFVLYDSNNKKGYIARDPYGVRPLYYGIYDGYLVCASLLKQINELTPECYNFNAGSYMSFDLHHDGVVHFDKSLHKYNSFIYNHTINSNHISLSSEVNMNGYYSQIYNDLLNAVKKRVITMDTNLACLLSGGLDSSLITSLVAKFIPTGQLQTYSIGMIGGSDLKYAKEVSNHIHSNHTEIILTEQEFFSTIPEVIYNIESYDTTTVRASVGNYLVAKYISKHSDAKVIFNGDGSDEVSGGYLYFHNCPSNIEFDHECKRLLNDIQHFDVLRSDRTIACHGLEARTPFLDRSFVSNYLQIPSHVRNHNNFNAIEKYLIRGAVHHMDPTLLPQNILWRKKEAFSDGVSSTERSWYEIIQDNLNSKYSDEEFKEISSKYSINTPTTKEQLYYREVFNSHYPETDKIVPYFWMPKYCNATDCSARSLSLYNIDNPNNNSLL
jgi:asparagine synthase (glutamine-hydrolysing)